MSEQTTAAPTRSVITPPVCESSASLRSPRIAALIAESPPFAQKYNAMLRGIAANVRFPPKQIDATRKDPEDKEGGGGKGGDANEGDKGRDPPPPTFTATSGITLPYYLSLVTSFLDPRVSVCVVDVLSTFLRSLPLETHRRWVIVGMEVAGGMLVSQLAAVPSLSETFFFVYMRKHRKTTGTGQQLEGPPEITAPIDTERPENEWDAIWIDDCCSTGSSLLGGVKTLKKEYRLNVRHAVFVVDRSADRRGLPPGRRFLEDPQFQPLARGGGGTSLAALADLADVEAFVTFPTAS